MRERGAPSEEEGGVDPVLVKEGFEAGGDYGGNRTETA